MARGRSARSRGSANTSRIATPVLPPSQYDFVNSLDRQRALLDDVGFNWETGALTSHPLNDFSFEDVSDARRYDPTTPRRFRGSVTIGGRPARIVVHKRPFIAYGQPIYAYRGFPKGLQVPVGVKYESPLRVIRCLRRKIRRNVIFALKKHRKGAGAKRRRRNEFSNVGC